jgi:hypothetical protein
LCSSHCLVLDTFGGIDRKVARKCDDDVTADAQQHANADQIASTKGRSDIAIDIRSVFVLCIYAVVGSEEVDDSAEITLLGSGAQGRDDAMQQR